MADDLRETQIHEAGHAVASYVINPTSKPEVWIDSARTGRTEFDTPEDFKDNAVVCLAGIVASHVILQSPQVVTAETMDDHGAGEDFKVIYRYLNEVYDGDEEERYTSDLGLSAFVDEVIKLVVPHQAKIIALANALELARVGDQAYLNIDEVNAVLTD